MGKKRAVPTQAPARRQSKRLRKGEQTEQRHASDADKEELAVVEETGMVEERVDDSGETGSEGLSQMNEESMSSEGGDGAALPDDTQAMETTDVVERGLVEVQQPGGPEGRPQEPEEEQQQLVVGGAMNQQEQQVAEALHKLQGDMDSLARILTQMNARLGKLEAHPPPAPSFSEKVIDPVVKSPLFRQAVSAIVVVCVLSDISRMLRSLLN